jgi:hypothetical protein
LFVWQVWRYLFDTTYILAKSLTDWHQKHSRMAILIFFETFNFNCSIQSLEVKYKFYIR